MELNLNLSKVIVGQEAIGFRSSGGILNSHDCVEWLRTRSELIGWTYSFTPYGLSLYNFKKLIANVCNGHLFVMNATIRFATNIHAKCYIAPESALISSFNLTAPTIEDIGVVIRDKRALKHLRREFNRQWKSLA